MDFSTSLAVAASGMRAQSDRMRIIAREHRQCEFDRDHGRTAIPIAARCRRSTANSTASSAPRWSKPGKPVEDMSDFRTQYDPGNPAADKRGYVKLPNVNPLIEIMDMREAQRSYEADLTVMDASKTMLSRTIDLLKR